MTTGVAEAARRLFSALLSWDVVMRLCQLPLIARGGTGPNSQMEKKTKSISMCAAASQTAHGFKQKQG